MPAISDDFYSKVTAELYCGEDDIIVSRDQVCRSPQYGVIERKSVGSTGSGGRGEAHKPQPNGYPNLPGLTLDISGYGACNADGHTSTQPTFSSKHGYLSVKKVREIEYWLAEVVPGGDDGSLDACTALQLEFPCESSQESWPRSILHRL